MEKKDLIVAEYLNYKFSDLEVEQESQNMKANNAKLSPVIRMDSLLRLEVIELVLEIAMAVAQAGQDVTSMTVGEIISIGTGKPINHFTSSGFSRAYHTVDGAIGKTVDVAVDGVRVGLNKFGGWLTKMTTQK